MDTMSVSLSHRLGQPMHTSLLLRRAERFGLHGEEDFLNLAYARGCRYYAPPGWNQPPDSRSFACPGEVLAIALLHPHLPYNPQRLRIGAAMLAFPGLNASTIARLARQERATPIVRYITQAAAHCEPATPFWKSLLDELPTERQPIPEGVMPHPSRFMAVTGRQGPGSRTVQHTWIRPSPAAA